ncbi:MAG: NAD-dependent epimerase/dehydratase family protein [Bacilli bacterium]
MNKIIREDVLQIINDNYQAMTKLKNTTFLITGASGMIGSYLVNTLLVLNENYNMNIKIIILVRNKNKLDDYVLHNNYVEIIEQDVINEIKYQGNIDYIIHAASPASPKIMKDYPFETNLANTVGTYNTLNLAIDKKVKCYLFISSREIYGQPADGQELFTENGKLGYVDPLVPRNGYAEGKKAAENMCVSAKEEYNINTKIVRLAHIYGPGMSINDGRVQADFLKNVLNNQNIVMKSNGESVRTYTYISDAINAIFKVMLLSKDIVYNISDENSKTTIRQLAETLVMLADEKIKIDLKLEESNGTAAFTLGILSSEKIRSELHWTPLYDIKGGFSRTIKYLKMKRK